MAEGRMGGLSPDEMATQVFSEMYVGNGKGSMKTRMETAEGSIKYLEKAREKDATQRSRLELALWVAILSFCADMILKHLR